MLQSRGLRISLVGVVVFLAGVVSLLFLPDLLAGAVMLLGGAGVWTGFIMTLLAYYLPPSDKHDHDEP